MQQLRKNNRSNFPMSAHSLILKHDRWRKGQGGASAGVAGRSDSDTYAGLDLNLITFSASTSSGSSFSATTFLDAAWTGCQFANCTWKESNFDNASLDEVKILACKGRRITAENLRKNRVDFTGSRSEDVQLANALIN